MEKSFLAVYDANADALFRHCVARVRDREMAKDIVQETFTRTWIYLAEGKTIEYMRAFLYRTLHNLIVDTMRKKRPASLDKMQEEDDFEPADESRDPDAMVREEMKKAVELVHALEESYASVITMRYIDQLSLREIADILKISENVVSVRIHRGLKQLRSLWKSNTAV